jgi:hypothetical protein
VRERGSAAQRDHIRRRCEYRNGRNAGAGETTSVKAVLYARQQRSGMLYPGVQIDIAARSCDTKRYGHSSTTMALPIRIWEGLRLHDIH